LTTDVRDDKFSMIGFQIDKTLSEHGSVSRGVCEVSADGLLTDIHERTKVYFKELGGEKKVFFEEDGEEFPLASDSRVSMNFWGFTPHVFDYSMKQFKEFALANQDKPKAEFFIPLVAEALIKSGEASF